MLRNNIETDLNARTIEDPAAQTRPAKKQGLSVASVNRTIKGQSQSANITFVKIMDERGNDAGPIYIKQSKNRQDINASCYEARICHTEERAA